MDATYKDEYAPSGRSGRLIIKKKLDNGEYKVVLDEKNVITDDSSILIAWLIKSSTGPGGGAVALAIGSGDPGWNMQSPPAAESTQRVLETEIFRKAITSSSFRDGDGDESEIPTNVIDLVTEFGEADAVGPWVEVAIVGGNAPSGPNPGVSIVAASGNASLANVDILLNYRTFAVINKPSGATFQITWRLQF